MKEVLEIFTKITEVYGEGTAILIILLVGLVYTIHSIVKNFSNVIQKYIEKKLLESEEEHKKGTIHRKNVTPEIRKLLGGLAKETNADRAILFEYSNGSSNLVGLPFLYVTATCEVVKPGVHTVAMQYQRISTTLFAEFLEHLEEDGLYFLENIDTISQTMPNLYVMMKQNGVQSALFYSLCGIDDTIGFIVITSTNGKLLTKDDTIPKIANTAQKISSFLNFNKIRDNE